LDGGSEKFVVDAGRGRDSVTRSARRICPFGHATRPGQIRCPVCGELLVEDRRKEDHDVPVERRKPDPGK
jgi:hypothetical protein